MVCMCYFRYAASVNVTYSVFLQDLLQIDSLSSATEKLQFQHEGVCVQLFGKEEETIRSTAERKGKVTRTATWH